MSDHIIDLEDIIIFFRGRTVDELLDPESSAMIRSDNGIITVHSNELIEQLIMIGGYAGWQFDHGFYLIKADLYNQDLEYLN